MVTAEEKLLENGYQGVIIFSGDSYDDALIGVSHDGRAIYDYDLMIQWLMKQDDELTREDAIEWIEYNTIRSIPYAGEGAPIVMYGLV